MAPKMNEICTLKPIQIVKNTELALGATKKNTGKYKRLTAEYGNIMPVIVCMQKNGTYNVISGCAGLDACVEAGIAEVPAVLSNLPNEKEQMKLSLMLTALPDECSALAEGIIINRLIKEHNLTQYETAKFLGKSRSWVCKRISLAKNLAESVKRMISDGTLCSRSAEEIAKMPKELQSEFAANVVNAGLSKNNICKLFKLYKNATDDATRLRVIKSPVTALSQTPELKAKPQLVAPGILGRHLQITANNAVRVLLNAINATEKSKPEELHSAYDNLLRLQGVAEEVAITLNRIMADFPRGKGGTSDDN